MAKVVAIKVLLHRNLLLPIGTKLLIARSTPPIPKAEKEMEYRKDKDADREFCFAGYTVMQRNSQQDSSSQPDIYTGYYLTRYIDTFGVLCKKKNDKLYM